MTRHRHPLFRRVVIGVPIVLILVYNLPILWLLLTSLKPRVEIYHIPATFVFAPTLENYIAVLKRASFIAGAGNTLKVAGLSTLVSTAVAAIGAYGVAKLGRAGHVARFVALITQMLPPIALIIPLYLLFVETNLRNTIGGLVLAYLAFGMPFALWILVPFFQDIPAELEEAAAIEGCSPFQTFRYVVLPLSVPVLSTVSILTFISAWNELLFALVLSGAETVTLQLAITQLISRQGPDMGVLSAGAVLALLPVLAFVFGARRYLVSGLTVGFGK